MPLNRFNLVSYYRNQKLNSDYNRDQGPGHPVVTLRLLIRASVAHSPLHNVNSQIFFRSKINSDIILCLYIFIPFQYLAPE